MQTDAKGAGEDDPAEGKGGESKGNGERDDSAVSGGGESKDDAAGEEREGLSQALMEYIVRNNFDTEAMRESNAYVCREKEKKGEEEKRRDEKKLPPRFAVCVMMAWVWCAVCLCVLCVRAVLHTNTDVTLRPSFFLRYLANDMLDRAITRKNERHERGGLDIASKLNLLPSDFGVELLSPDEIQRKRAKAQFTVDQMVGWGSDAIEGSARWFFAQAKQMVELAESKNTSSGVGGATLSNSWPGGMWVTGNAGSGKNTFARLAFAFLRSFGVVTKDNFVETSASQLKSGKGADNVRAAFKQAHGGVLFIDEAHGLTLGDRASKEVVTALLTEVENKLGEVQVILAGYPDEMQKFMRVDPGMASRFPTRIHIDDYSLPELAEIARRYASKKNLAFEKGLGLRLEKYIE